MAHVGKRIKAAREGVDRIKLYKLDEAVGLVKDRAKAKFDETVEISMNLGVDPKHADQMVRGVVALPHGSGKSMRVAVFAKGDKANIVLPVVVRQIGLGEKCQQHFSRSAPDVIDNDSHTQLDFVGKRRAELVGRQREVDPRVNIKRSQNIFASACCDDAACSEQASRAHRHPS